MLFRSAAGTPVADGGGDTPTPGDAGVVLAAPARGRRRGVIAAVAAGVVLVAAVAGVAVIRSRGPAPAQDPQTTAAADSRTARLVTLGLRDLPAGWAVAPTATAPVRPPLPAPAVQSGADSTLAICLGSDPATVAGLLGQVPLPGTAATYASPTFQSPTGPAVAMSGRTTVLSDPAQIRTLGSTLTGPNFLPCLTQYEGTMIAGAVTGATVATRPVALPAPAGTQAVGVVSTYTLPGVGTEVVGQAFIFGGAVLSVMVPTTSGADIPADVFSAAYGRVAARVAAAAK